MTKFKLIILMLVAALSVTSCNSDEYGGSVQTPANLISFAVSNDAPIVIAPGEEVVYSFNVTYAKGLASMKVSLDGEVIEESEKIWDDAPTEAQYSFSYLVKESQFGQTLDFVFTATGIDGYSQSVDYPLWVSASDLEFVINMPENLPAEVYSDVNLEYEVDITSDNPLESLTVTKNGAEYDSKTEFGDTQKSYKYQFAYMPATEDVNKEVRFHFVATDVKGNKTEAYYSVKVLKADVVVKVIYEEIFDTSMSVSSTTEYNTTAGGISGDPATQFKASKITEYNTFQNLADPEDPESEKIPNIGAMEGCSVYDGDKTPIKYTCDGTDVCLSKYDNNSVKNVYGTYMWFRKAKKGWFRADGIKLHGAMSLKLTYSQSGGAVKAEYSTDNGTTWSEIMATKSASEMHESKFSLSASAETVSLRFSENGGSAHARIDNIKLVEIQ